jgi:hypothetical protein
MIGKTKQDWTVGKQVKVGFLTLTVKATRETPGDGMPDAYLLERRGELYEFVPHNGLTSLMGRNPAELGY